MAYASGDWHGDGEAVSSNFHEIVTGRVISRKGLSLGHDKTKQCTDLTIEQDLEEQNSQIEPKSNKNRGENGRLRWRWTREAIPIRKWVLCRKAIKLYNHRHKKEYDQLKDLHLEQ